MQGVGIDLCETGTKIGPDEKLETFEFGLEDYEAEAGFWVCAAGLVFYNLDLVRASVHHRELLG